MARMQTSKRGGLPKTSRTGRNANRYLRQNGGLGFFGKALGVLSFAAMPLQALLMMSGGMFNLFAKATEGAGNSERITKRKFLDKAVGKPLRFLGRIGQKPLEFALQPMGSLAEKGRFTGLLDSFSEKQGKVMEFMNDKLGVSGRMDSRLERKANKLQTWRQNKLTKYSGVNSAFNTIDELTKLAAGDPLKYQEARATFLEGALDKNVYNLGERKAIEGYLVRKEDQARRGAKADTWRDPVNAIKEHNRNVTAGEVAGKVIRGVFAAKQIYGDVATTNSYIKSLKLLAADSLNIDVSELKGFAGTRRVLFGKNMPKVVKEARRVMRFNLLPRLGSTVGFLFLMKPMDKAISRMGMGRGGVARAVGSGLAYQVMNDGINNLTHMIAKDYDTANIYAALRMKEDMAKAGEAPQLEAYDYLDMIVSTSKTVRMNGGEDNKYAQLCAQYYAEHQTPLTEVLKDLNGGDKQIEKRAQEAQQYFLVEAANQERAAAAAAQANARAAIPGAALDKQAEANYWRTQQSKGGAGLNQQAEANYWSSQQNKPGPSGQDYRDLVTQQRLNASRAPATIGAG